MRLDVRCEGLEASHALRGYAERRLLFALSRFAPRILWVRVRLADSNGPRRRGIDKRCRIEVRGDRSWTIVLEETGSDSYVAIDRAADRAGRAVARAIDRARRARRLPTSGFPGMGLRRIVQ